MYRVVSVLTLEPLCVDPHMLSFLVGSDMSVFAELGNVKGVYSRSKRRSSHVSCTSTCGVVCNCTYVIVASFVLARLGCLTYCVQLRARHNHCPSHRWALCDL